MLALLAVMVNGPRLPVPERLTLWVAAVAFRALSVNVAALTMLPVVCGMKLTLRLQLAPDWSEKLLVQSAGVPEPGTCTKDVAPMLRPGATASSDWLPMFCTVTDCGLSVLVLNTTVAAKLNVGTPERSTSTTWLLLKSPMKTSPAPSTAIPVGPLSPLPTVVRAPPPPGTSTTRL